MTYDHKTDKALLIARNLWVAEMTGNGLRRNAAALGLLVHTIELEEQQPEKETKQ